MRVRVCLGRLKLSGQPSQHVCALRGRACQHLQEFPALLSFDRSNFFHLFRDLLGSCLFHSCQIFHLLCVEEVRIFFFSGCHREAALFLRNFLGFLFSFLSGAVVLECVWCLDFGSGAVRFMLTLLLNFLLGLLSCQIALMILALCLLRMDLLSLIACRDLSLGDLATFDVEVAASARLALGSWFVAGWLFTLHL